jgi:hypothetical protein
MSRSDRAVRSSPHREHEHMKPQEAVKTFSRSERGKPQMSDENGKVTGSPVHQTNSSMDYTEQHRARCRVPSLYRVAVARGEG